jgi:hypothetical protein
MRFALRPDLARFFFVKATWIDKVQPTLLPLLLAEQLQQGARAGRVADANLHFLIFSEGPVEGDVELAQVVAMGQWNPFPTLLA